MLSVGAIRIEDRVCASKKGGIGGGVRISAQSAVHMAATLGGCRKALVDTGWSISLLFDKQAQIRFLCPFRGSISGTVDSFQSGEAFNGRRALTIVNPLMSGHGRGHEP